MNILFYIIFIGSFVNALKINTSNIAANIITSSLLLNTPLSPILAPEQIPSNGALQKTYVEVVNNDIFFYGGVNSDSAKALKDSLRYAINNGVTGEKVLVINPGVKPAEELNKKSLELQLKSFTLKLVNLLVS